jgi:hypothetical protein
VAVLLEEHPLQRARPFALVARPVFRALGEVIEDRVGFEEMAAVGQADGRYLAVRVLGEEVGGAGRPVIDIELYALTRKAEMGKQQPDLVGVAGNGGIVEHEFGLAGHMWLLKG